MATSNDLHLRLPDSFGIKRERGERVGKGGGRVEEGVREAHQTEGGESLSPDIVLSLADN